MKNEFKIATPVSQFFKDMEVRKKLITYSDVLELRDNEIQIDSIKPFIYHSKFNILANWTSKEEEKLIELNKKYHLKAISFHLLSRYQENEIINNAFKGIGKPMTLLDIKKNVNSNIKLIRKVFKKGFTILVENVNHLLTDAYDIIVGTNFIKEIVELNDIYLLFDLAHAQITCINKNLDFKEYINELPIIRIKQIHLSGFEIIDGKAHDSHVTLKEKDWEIFKELAAQTNCLEYITLEYYKDAINFVVQLKKLRKIINEVIFENFFKILPWDSSFFGYSIARLDYFYLNKDLFKFCIKKAKEENIECIYFTSNSNLQELNESNRLIDIEIRNNYSRDLREVDLNKNLSIELATSKDISKIKDIASEAFRNMTRFYFDPHFKNEKVDELYIKWVDKLYYDSDSEIIIIKVNKNIAAFNGITIKEESARITLIAVNELFRRKGYGERIIDHAIQFLIKKNIRKIKVSTQKKNLAANNLYSKLEFKLTNKKYLYHWWNEEIV
ncbi:hypothetical protein LCGC14_0712420 [marine sediment metagenome]|uniref:N-acetyltransferase domain-containing protein n=1 Tax=marine sediment metagenome TaxID=412755 RepID=A0A0F9QJ51_9ZZZZ|nr:DUF692 family protein [archaeon]